MSAFQKRADNYPSRTYLERFDGGAFVRAHGRARHRGLHRATRDVRAFPEARAGDGRALRADGVGGGGGEGKGHSVERWRRVLAGPARRGAVCCARGAPDPNDLFRRKKGDVNNFSQGLTWLRTFRMGKHSEMVRPHRASATQKAHAPLRVPRRHSIRHSAALHPKPFPRRFERGDAFRTG